MTNAAQGPDCLSFGDVGDKSGRLSSLTPRGVGLKDPVTPLPDVLSQLTSPSAMSLFDRQTSVVGMAVRGLRRHDELREMFVLPR